MIIYKATRLSAFRHYRLRINELIFHCGLLVVYVCRVFTLSFDFTWRAPSWRQDQEKQKTPQVSLIVVCVGRSVFKLEQNESDWREVLKYLS